MGKCACDLVATASSTNGGISWNWFQTSNFIIQLEFPEIATRCHCLPSVMAEQKGTYLEEYLESVVLLPSEIKRVRPTTTHATHHVASLFSTRLYRELRVRADREQITLGEGIQRPVPSLPWHLPHLGATRMLNTVRPCSLAESLSGFALGASYFTLHAPRSTHT